MDMKPIMDMSQVNTDPLWTGNFWVVQIIMFIWFMLNFKTIEKKLTKPEKNQSKTVDINILKARAQQIQDREKKKNIFIFVFILAFVGAAGTYVSI